MGRGKGGIPDRWLPYTPVGSVISGTRFAACKVPLKEALLRGLPEKDRFGPTDLFKAFPNLGLLVDLTNTDRYYEKQEFTKQNVQYEKIYCPGQVIPPNSIIKRFFVIVDTFLDKTKDSDSVIVVHCTHGVNRTGYFISRYMIEKMEIPPDEAVDRVQQARGHKIERQNYVRDLTEGCKGGSEADMRFVPKHRNKNRLRSDGCEKEPSELTNMYRTTRPTMSSRRRTGRRALEPEGRSSRDNWRVRGPPAAGDHGPPSREYPQNCAPRPPLLTHPSSHWQPRPNQWGPPPDLSWARESTYGTPSHDQFQNPLPLPHHQQARSQQRLASDKAVGMSNGFTGQSNFVKQPSFEHSSPPAPLSSLKSLPQQSPLHSFSSRPTFSFHYEESSSYRLHSGRTASVPQQAGSHSTPNAPQQARYRSTPSIPQQAGPRSTPNAPPQTGYRSTPNAPQQAGSRSTPNAPQQAGSRSTPNAPQQAGYRSMPSIPQQAGFRSTPNAPQQAGSRSTPNGPQQAGSRSTPNAPQQAGYRSTPSIPQQAGSRSTPNAPQQAGFRSTPNGPQQAGSRSTSNAPQQAAPRSTPSIPQQAGSRSTPNAPQQAAPRSTPSIPQQAGSSSTPNAPQQAAPRSTPSILQQAGSRSTSSVSQQAESRLFNSRQSSWNPLPSFVNTGPSLQ